MPRLAFACVRLSSGIYIDGSLQVLTKLNLASKYEGVSKVDGEVFNVEYVGEGSRPFRAFLDVGLTRTTTGNKVFAVLKGAVDGGIDIPHR